MYVAQEKGYYQEQGLEIEFQRMQGAGEMIAPLASGQVDVAIGAPSAGLFNAVGRGVSLLVVGDKGSFRDGDRWNSIAVRPQMSCTSSRIT